MDLNRKQITSDLAIVGMGAGGLFAAALITLLRNGKFLEALNRPYVEAEVKDLWQADLTKFTLAANLKISLIEGQEQVGKKLNLTGGQRANLATNLTEELLAAKYFAAKDFLRKARQYLTPSLLRSLLYSMDIATYYDEQGRLYPKSNQAKEVTSKLLHTALANPLSTIYYSEKITDISMDGQQQIILTGSKHTFITKTAILATGGASYPKTGSDGAFLKRLTANKQFNCSAYPAKPALAALQQNNFPLADLQGISLTDVTLTWETFSRLSKEEERRYQRLKRQSLQGDLLINKKGFSGPCAMNLARFLREKAEDNSLTVTWLPADLIKHVSEKLKQAINAGDKRPLGLWLKQNLPLPERLQNSIREKLLTQKYRHQTTMPVKYLTAAEAADFLEVFCHWHSVDWHVADLLHAQVTSGGIKRTCIDPNTMACKAAANVHIVGELLDIDAACGGFNLLAAFATSTLAVKSLLLLPAQ